MTVTVVSHLTLDGVVQPGEGRQLFPAGYPCTRLAHKSAKPSATGVIIAAYQPDQDPGGRGR